MGHNRSSGGVKATAVDPKCTRSDAACFLFELKCCSSYCFPTVYRVYHIDNPSIVSVHNAVSYSNDGERNGRVTLVKNE